MDDRGIIELYFMRDEAAIEQTRAKYGGLCHSIAFRIVGQQQDAEECVNDTYLGAWNAIPPQRPINFAAFLSKIARNIALKRCRSRAALKRGGGELSLSLDELEECVAASDDVVNRMEVDELARILDKFLESLPIEQRRMFMCRYWYVESIADISRRFGFSQSKVKMSLKRARGKLAVYLEEEGVRL